MTETNEDSPTEHFIMIKFSPTGISIATSIPDEDMVKKGLMFAVETVECGVATRSVD